MKQGDIVVISFPFSNLAEQKVRPAVVLSNNTYNRHKNVILAGIYGTKMPQAIKLTNNELQRQKLTKTSYISLQNIFSAEHTIVHKKIDMLTKEMRESILERARACF